MTKIALTSIPIVALLLFSPIASADEKPNNKCDDKKNMIYINQMGMVDSTILQEHITSMRKRVKKAQRTKAKSDKHRRLLERHMDDMLSAMTQLSGEGTAVVCKPGTNTLTTDERIENLEKRLDLMQNMLKQFMEHEQERERVQ